MSLGIDKVWLRRDGTEVLGALGVIAPTTSALLHNGSTIAIALSAMRPLNEN